MNTQKILKIIFSLIGLSIIITSGVFIVQTLKDLDNLKFSQVKNFLNKEEEKQILEDTDIDTTNWKTYRNEEFGFEFKYPEEWKVKINEENNIINTELSLNGNQSSFYTDIFNITFFLNNENLNLREWISQNIDIKDKAKYTEEVLNTSPKIQAISLSTDNPFEDLVFIPGRLFQCNKYICDFSYAQGPGVLQSYYPTLNTRYKQLSFVEKYILPTFKFFEPEPVNK